MGSGGLSLEVYTGTKALPVNNAEVTIKDNNGNILYTLTTNENGMTEKVNLETVDVATTLDPNYGGIPYKTYVVEVKSPDYINLTIRGVQIFDTVDSVLPVNMLPMLNMKGAKNSAVINIPENNLLNKEKRIQETEEFKTPKILSDVYIPNNIKVHLGTPTSNAQNVEVPFIDYIKNVASSEIYPSWPENAIKANMHAQISFALNRLYTEWYPSKGYSFNITNVPAYDQYYVPGRNIYENISDIADEIFNVYIRREGRKEPYISQFCNGTTSTCNGLSQWGTVTLAEQGYNPINILKYYYPNDIELVQSFLYENIEESYPGYALKLGSKGDDVLTIQNYLNRIRVNYPLIPEIENPDGNFDKTTEEAVKTFQKTFNIKSDGIVGKGTWFEISRVYNAVKKLSELDSEGEVIGVPINPPNAVLKQGSKGTDVLTLQFLLNYIAEFYNFVPSVIQNAVFDERTKISVMEFQRNFGLTPDGIVGPATWNKLYEVYYSIDDAVDIPEGNVTNGYPPYPGVVLKVGSRGNDVLVMQQYLSDIAKIYPNISNLTADGIFGAGTKASVVAFQNQFGLVADGVVGELTWNKIMEVHATLGDFVTDVPYPGFLLKRGSRGEYVKIMQSYLNSISNVYSSIPKLDADGIFGLGTENAVKAFQREFGLVADGIVGPATWNAIVREYNNSISNRKDSWFINIKNESDNKNRKLKDKNNINKVIISSMFLARK